MNPQLYLLYLDRYHQGDPLFLRELAQHFARADTEQLSTLLLHTSGEKLERTLEAEGLFPERQGGVVRPETPRQEALAERAAREANQELVGLLTDEIVTAVGLQGADRGLLQRGEGGTLSAGSLGWVEDLIKMRVLPVISALAEGPDGAEEVAPARAAVVLGEALEGFDVTICFLATGDLPEEHSVAVDVLPDEVFAESDVMAEAVESQGSVLLTNLRGYFAADGPRGTEVTAG